VEPLRTQLEVAQEATAAEQDRYNGLLEALEARTTTHDTRVGVIITSLHAGSEAQDRVVDLERDVATLQDKLGTARFSRDELAVRLEAVESKVHDSRIELGSAEVRAAELVNDLAETRAELKESVDREDELKRKVERLEEALDREIDVATQERQRSATTAKEVAVELEAAVQAKAEADGICSELRRQLVDVEEEMTILRQDLDDAQNELHDARIDNIALMESALELEQAQEELSRLADVDEDLEETAKDLAQAQQEIARLEEKCATLEKVGRSLSELTTA
jgi:chromosome segregation ATPase